MLDVIAWLDTKRGQMFLNQERIISFRDVPIESLGLKAGQGFHVETRDSGEDTVCMVHIEGLPKPLILFHDALQLARAITTARGYATGFDPIKVDDMEI